MHVQQGRTRCADGLFHSCEAQPLHVCIIDNEEVAATCDAIFGKSGSSVRVTCSQWMGHRLPQHAQLYSGHLILSRDRCIGILLYVDAEIG